MKRSHKIGAAIGAALILIETAILICQFCSAKSSPNNQSNLPPENGGYDAESAAGLYDRIAEMDESIARLELRLNVIAKALESKDNVPTLPRKLMPALGVIDKETLAPIPGVHVIFSGGSSSGETDSNGVFTGGADRLQRGGQVWLYHPDYEILTRKRYKLDATNMATFAMKRGGDASLSIKVNLTVRGERVDYPCSIALQEKTGKEVRRVDRSEDRTCLFYGLAPGEYVINVRSWECHITHKEPVQIEKGQCKVVEIDAKTDQRGQIRVRGMVLSKRDGKPIQGVRVIFAGAPDDSAMTGKDGSFSSVSDRCRFHQTYLRLDARWNVLVRINNDISEDLAKKLEFHLDPDVGYAGRELRDEDGDGVFCDKKGCVICERR